MRTLTTSILKAQGTRRKVIKGVSYPTIILSIGFIVMRVILYVIVPKFAAQLAEAGADAPMSMRMMMGMSIARRSYGPIIFGVIAGTGYLLVKGYRAQGAFRVRADRLLLRVPILGTLIEQAAIAGWARLFSILYSSRTDPIKAVELTAETLTNAELRDRFMRVADAQSLGRDIAAQMRVVGIPAVAAKMLQVGTESSRVAEMMNELAEYYEEETDYTVDKLTSRMEPIALVVVMVPVGTLLSGGYLMMTQSMRAIGAG